MKKQKKQFSPEAKRQAIDDYITGRKSAVQIGAEMDCAPNLIYRWKSEFEAEQRSGRVSELKSEGHNPEDIRKIMDLEDELEEYKKKLAEQILINDLLKKLRDSKISQPESELTGLIRTKKNLGVKRKPVK
jgi:transposase-like protein